MRFPRRAQRFVAPWGTPPKAQAPALACVLPIQYSVSGPHMGASPKAKVAALALWPRANSAHPSHVLWPHEGGFSFGPHWQRPFGGRAQFRHAVHTLRGPVRGSTEGDAHNDGIHNC
eukprot:5420224-Pyramimonas_sp.AAC.1